MGIENISDTARWVAAFRAVESERPDALFEDPFARALAGARGFELARSLPGAFALRWSMAIRTRVLDELLLQAIASGADTVLNLAAGLDTRPQRLPLPARLTWIEADLPGILAHKESVLGGVPARCQLLRHRVDLGDAAARQELLERVGRQGKQVVVLTEGLLIYLAEPAVAALARELHAQSSFAAWMMDLVGPEVLLGSRLQWNRALAKGNARMQFGPRDGPRHFERFGWRVHAFKSFADEGARLQRGVPAKLWGVSRGSCCRRCGAASARAAGWSGCSADPAAARLSTASALAMLPR